VAYFIIFVFRPYICKITDLKQRIFWANFLGEIPSGILYNILVFQDVTRDFSLNINLYLLRLFFRIKSAKRYIVQNSNDMLNT
jgi:hypothetical protein